MTQHLVFQLYGPMASWGDIAVGEERPSRTHPGKSAVIGLLAAAIGIRRHEEQTLQDLAAGYRLAVQVRQAGVLLRDYHTVQIPPRVALKGHPHQTRRDELIALDRYQRRHGGAGTLLSAREYRCDAQWQAALTATESAPYSLTECADYLRRPRLALYLGRKSCPPALPLQPQLVEAASVREAFAQAQFPPLEGIPPLQDLWSLYWELGMDSGCTDADGIKTLRRRDQPLSRRRWQFADRDEHHASLKRED